MPLSPDCSCRSMPRANPGFVGQHENFLANAGHELLQRATREIGAADAVQEQHVASKQL